MANLRFALLIWFCTLPYTALHTICLSKTALYSWSFEMMAAQLFAYIEIYTLNSTWYCAWVVFFVVYLSGLQGALGALILPSGLHHFLHKSSPSPRANMSEVQLLPWTLIPPFQAPPPPPWCRGTKSSNFPDGSILQAFPVNISLQWQRLVSPQLLAFVSFFGCSENVAKCLGNFVCADPSGQ